MKNNYFVKNLLTLAMLLSLTMGMVSCQGFIDAVLGTEDKPVSQPTTQPEQPKATVVTVTAEGAKVEASNASEVSKALGNLVDDIKAKGVGEGKEYKVEVSGVSSESSASENTIVVPKVENSNINLVFNEAVASTSAPLVVKASETTSTESTTAVNEVTITVPNAESLELKVDMPETTVTLKSSGTNSVFKSIVAKTATNTLIIESGITVEELEVQGGRIIVKEGGAIETYVYPAGKKNIDEAFISVDYDSDLASYAGVLPIKLKNGETECWEISTDEKGEKPYLTKYLKVVKGTEDIAEVKFLNRESHPLLKMIVGDGATALVKNLRAEAVEGEGTAKISLRIQRWSENWRWNSDKNENETLWAAGSYGIKGVKKVSNIIFTPLYREITEWPNESFEYTTYLEQVTAQLDNCTFQLDGVKFGDEGEYTLASGISINNCKFETTRKDDIFDGLGINVSSLNSGEEFTMTFKSCEFGSKSRISTGVDTYVWPFIGYSVYPKDGDSYLVNSIDEIPIDIYNGINGTYFRQYDYSKEATKVEYNNNTVLINFSNCLIGGFALTASSDIFPNQRDSNIPSGVTIKYNIDNTIYTYVLEGAGTTSAMWVLK